LINKPIAQATARVLSWQRHTHNLPAACSNLGTVLQQAHQHAALVVLATKENGQQLDFRLLSGGAKPILSTIQSQVAKASASGYQSFSKGILIFSESN